MSSFYENIGKENNRKVWIYKQKNSKKYYIGIREDGNTIQKSLRTEDYNRARHIALGKLFEEDKSIMQGFMQKSKKYTIKVIAKEVYDDVMKSNRIKQKEDKERILRYIIEDNISEIDFKEVDTALIKDFIERTASSTTQQSIRRTCWDMIINKAIEKKVIKQFQKPELPKKLEKEEKGKRQEITEHEKSELLKCADDFIENTRNKITKQNRKLLKKYVQFISETGIRPGLEMSHIRLSDIKLYGMSDENKMVFTATIRKGKVHGSNESSYREVVLNKEAMKILDKVVKEIHKSEWAIGLDKRVEFNKDKKDLYIWRRTSEQDLILEYSRYFKQWLVFAKLDDEKEMKVPYSARHKYINNELKSENGPSIHLLASQCGTSVIMIEKYYQEIEAAMKADKFIRD